MDTKNEIKFSIKTKFLIAFVSIILFISLSLIFCFVTMTKREFLKEIEKRGASEAKDLASEVRYGVFTENKTILDNIIANRIQKPDIAYIEIVREDGLVLAKAMKKEDLLLSNINVDAVQQKDLGDDVYRYSVRLENRENIYEFSTNIVDKQDLVKDEIEGMFFFGGEPNEVKEAEPVISTIGNVKVGIFLKDMKERLAEIIFIGIFVLFLVIIVAIIMSVIFVNIMVKPISKVTKAAIEISDGDLTKSVDVKSADEIGVMARNFNKMTASLRNTIKELRGLKVGLEKEVENRTVDLKKANIEMLKAYRKLSELEQIKTNFVSTVSHELRTPLTSVVGFANNTREFYKNDIMPQLQMDNKRIKMKSKSIENNLTIIVSEGERLTRLINDVLDISKMEAGKIEWNIKDVDINKVCLQALAIVKGYPKSSLVNIRFESPGHVRAVKADTDRLVQVITNFLSNALKFTESGTITLKVEARDIDVKISVIDTGIGIDKDEIRNVFEKFKQAGDTLTEKPKGTGLGLPICKEIIGHFGGSIWVESEVGKGSCFSFTLNYFKGEEKESAVNDVHIKQRFVKEVCGRVKEGYINRKRNILVVDDDENFREFARQVLNLEGYNVFEAKDGKQAIVIIEELENYLDLILLDIVMPEVDGFDVLRVIKENLITTHAPIMVISAYKVECKAYSLGADKFLVKPISKDGLITNISVLLKRGKKMEKVLIIDSNKKYAHELKFCLEKAGHIVSWANNCEDGICKARFDKPDVVMMDIVLPDIKSGEKAVKRLRGDKELCDMRLVLLVDEKNNRAIRIAESLKVANRDVRKVQTEMKRR